jgi:urease accessory protein
MTAATSDLLVWQLVDSAFPTGAFAHSWGLEAAYHHGELAGADGLRRFLKSSLQQAATGALPLVTAAHREPTRLDEWDALADAFLTTTVANRASRQQGRTLVASAARIWPTSILPLAAHLKTRMCHVAPATGAVFAALGIDLHTSHRAVMFLTARGVLSASVRLGLAGSYEAQGLQSACASDIETLLARPIRAVADLAQVAPLVDTFQGTHDRLYSRLFQS